MSSEGPQGGCIAVSYIDQRRTNYYSNTKAFEAKHTNNLGLDQGDRFLSMKPAKAHPERGCIVLSFAYRH